MITLVHFQTCLSEFGEKFDQLASRYDHTIQHSAELEAAINDYSRFVTDQENKAAWNSWSLRSWKNWIRLYGNYVINPLSVWRSWRNIVH